MLVRAAEVIVVMLGVLILALIFGTIIAKSANRAAGIANEYVTTATISAPPVTVWNILTDAPGYANWNAELVAIAGQFAEGERIKASVKLGSGAIRSVPMRITAFDAPRQMEWTGGMPLGLFVGKRTLYVTPRDAGADFRMELSMTGVLAPLILKSVGDRQPEVDAFAAALKTYAERS
jgi:hypothetical protein